MTQHREVVDAYAMSQLASLAQVLQESICEHVLSANLCEHIGLAVDSTAEDVSSLVLDHFASLPNRYVLSVDIDDVIHHLHLIAKCTSTTPSVTCTLPKFGIARGIVVVTIVCIDRPKILSNSIMHVLDGATNNIVDADIMTTSHGLVLDRIVVEVESAEQQDLKRLENLLNTSLTGVCSNMVQSSYSRGSLSVDHGSDNDTDNTGGLASSEHSSNPDAIHVNSLTQIQAGDNSTETITGSDEKIIHPSDVLLVGEIGRGLETVTYMGTFLKSGEKVAIKKPVLNALRERSMSHDGASDKSLENLRMWRDEVSLMLTIGNHLNICRFIGAYLESTTDMFLCYEFLSGGALSGLILDPSGHIDGHKIALEVASGMRHLHAVGVLHRDLKSGNIMLDSQGHAKICDFGLSCFLRPDGEPTAETGTYRWMAPEVIRHEKYSFSADVYSYGILLWEIFARAKPYADLTPIQAAFGVAKDNLRPPIPASLSPTMKALMSRCWHRTPSYRPCFEDICRLLSSMNAPAR